jgi:hypothetical protein
MMNFDDRKRLVQAEFGMATSCWSCWSMDVVQPCHDVMIIWIERRRVR